MKNKLFTSLIFAGLSIPQSFSMEKENLDHSIPAIEHDILSKMNGLHPIFTAWHILANDTGPLEIAESFVNNNSVEECVTFIEKLYTKYNSSTQESEKKNYELRNLWGILTTLRHVETWVQELKNTVYTKDQPGFLSSFYCKEEFCKLNWNLEEMKKALTLTWHKDAYCAQSAIMPPQFNTVEKIKDYWDKQMEDHYNVSFFEGDQLKAFFCKLQVSAECRIAKKFLGDKNNRDFIETYRKLCEEVYKKFDSHQYTVMIRTINAGDIEYEWGKDTHCVGLALNFTPLAGCLTDPSACSPMIYANKNRYYNKQLITFWVVPNAEFEKASEWKNVAPFYKETLLDSPHTKKEGPNMPYGIYAPFKKFDVTLQTAIGLTYYGEMAHPRIFGKHPFKPFTEFSQEEQKNSPYKDWSFWKETQDNYATTINLTFMLLPELSKVS